MTVPRIVLVEDSPADVQLCQFALADAGIEVDLIIARDGEEALDLLLGPHRKGPDGEVPALVLLDLKLPLVSGPEVLDALRRHPATKTVPIVVMTSSNQPSDIQVAYQKGANGYVMKPGDFEGYVRLVRAVHGFWIDHNLAVRPLIPVRPTP